MKHLTRISLGLLGATLLASPSLFADDEIRTVPTGQANTLTQAATDASSSALGAQLSLLRVEAGDFSIGQFNGANVDSSAMLAGTDMKAPIGYKGVNAPADPLQLFVTGVGSFGEINAGVGSANSSFYSGGALVGAAYRLTNDVTVGVDAGYEHGKLSYFQSASNLKVDTARFGTFATWTDHKGDWANVLVGGAYHDYTSQVDTGFGPLLNGTTGSLEFDTQATYGHDFKIAGFTVTPTAGLDYIHQNIDAYAVTVGGSGVDGFDIDHQTTNSLRTQLGTTLAYALKSGSVKWSPYVQGGWNHELLDAVAQTNLGGFGFNIPNENIGRETATFGAGVNALFTPTLSGTLGYAGEANSKYEEHTFQASVGLAF